MNDKNSALQIATTAAFMMEGLHDAGYNDCIAAWDKGCIEMVQSIVSYAPLVSRLLDALEMQDFPGVFDYEVSSPFGKWFGDYILEHGDEPPKQDACSWLSKEVESFFTQKEMTAPEVAEIHAAIHEVVATELATASTSGMKP